VRHECPLAWKLHEGVSSTSSTEYKFDKYYVPKWGFTYRLWDTGSKKETQLITLSNPQDSASLAL